MDYLRNGNDSHLVVGSEVVKMEREPDSGLIALITQISKALHRRTSEELLGMRLKQFMLLGYVRDHGNGGVSQQELERKQAEYCKVNYEQAMGRGDETTALAAEGPLGPCRPSVMNSIKKWNSSNAE